MSRFLSKSSNLVLCMKPADKSRVDGVVYNQPGEHIRFNNGEYETNDKKEIEFIRNHRLIDSMITEVDAESKGKKE